MVSSWRKGAMHLWLLPEWKPARSGFLRRSGHSGGSEPSPLHKPRHGTKSLFSGEPYKADPRDRGAERPIEDRPTVLAPDTTPQVGCHEGEAAGVEAVAGSDHAHVHVT